MGLADDSRDLGTGRAVQHARYDHASGRFTPPREVRPGRVVIVEGLHALYPRGLRGLYDLRVYLAPDEDVRLAWKLRRDVAERGHTGEAVAASVESRAAPAAGHVRPQRPHADWVIELRPEGPIDRAGALAGRLPALMSRHVLWNDAPVERLVAALAATGECRATLAPIAGDIDRLELTVTDGLTAASAARIAVELFPDLRQITRGWRPPRFHDGHAGVAQLVTLALLEPGRRG
jgi:hypothetical protein